MLVFGTTLFFFVFNKNILHRHYPIGENADKKEKVMINRSCVPTFDLFLVLDETCTAPHVPNAKPENKSATSYKDGHTVRFVCDGGYEFEGTTYALCEDGTWRLPVCKRK